MKPGAISAMATQLETWCTNCGMMMKVMETEMSRANKTKEQQLADCRRLEDEVSIVPLLGEILSIQLHRWRV